jgi:hypothetical protein
MGDVRTEKTGLKIKLQVARETHGYSRERPEVAVSYVCEVCGKHNTLYTVPGLKEPRYCPPAPNEKKSACQRKADAERVKRWRAAHPEAAQAAAKKQNDRRPRKSAQKGQAKAN